MTARKLLALLGGVLLLGLLAWAAFEGLSSPPTETAVSAPRGTASPLESASGDDSGEALPLLTFGYDWAEGWVTDYDVTLSYTSTLETGQDGALRLDGSLRLTGTLRLRVLASGGQGIHVGLSFPAIDELDWTIAGTPQPPDEMRRAYFQGQQAVVVFAEDGRVTSLRFPPDTPRPFANVVETLMRELQSPIVVGETTWTTSVDAAFGRVPSTYTVSSSDEASCRVEMRREATDYERFFFAAPTTPGPSTGGGAGGEERAEGETSQRFVVGRPGYLLRSEVRERLAIRHHDRRVVDITLSARLSQTRRVWEPPQRSFVNDRGWLETQALPDRSRRNALENRAAGMTMARLRADLLQYGNGGRVPRHKRWLWRVTGLLTLHPELAYELADVFRDPSLQGVGKSLVLDLLANVGSPEAQEVLRDLLGDPAVRARDDYPSLVQRFLLVREPDDASLEFLERTYRGDGPPDNRYASVTALGAALGRASTRDPAGALRRARALRDDLADAHDPTTRRALVMALGSAGREELEDDILRETTAQDRALRAAAAEALRKIHTPAATDRLIELLGTDGDPAVQAAALRALEQHSPSPEQWRRLAEVAASAPLAEQNLRRFIQLLGTVGEADGPGNVLPVAEALQRRTIRDSSVAHALAELVLRLRQPQE